MISGKRGWGPLTPVGSHLKDEGASPWTLLEQSQHQEPLVLGAVTPKQPAEGMTISHDVNRVGGQPAVGPDGANLLHGAAAMV